MPFYEIANISPVGVTTPKGRRDSRHNDGHEQQSLQGEEDLG